MNEKIEYYELVKRSYEIREGQIATAAVRCCSLCRKIISGMGGGSPSICIPCGDELTAGKLLYERSENDR